MREQTSYLLVAKSDKNSKYFPGPEKFDPSGFKGNGVPTRSGPFHGGHRTCPGKEYVRLQGLVFHAQCGAKLQT